MTGYTQGLNFHAKLALSVIKWPYYYKWSYVRKILAWQIELHRGGALRSCSALLKF